MSKPFPLRKSVESLAGAAALRHPHSEGQKVLVESIHRDQKTGVCLCGGLYQETEKITAQTNEKERETGLEGEKKQTVGDVPPHPSNSGSTCKGCIV